MSSKETTPSAAGEQVFTLRGTEQPYRLMVETMAEGAVIVAPDGIILYCNQRFAEMVKAAPPAVAGSNFLMLFAGNDAASITMAVHGRQEGTTRLRAALLASDATPVPVVVALRGQTTGGVRSVTVVVTDLSELVTAQGERRTDEDTIAQLGLYWLVVNKPAP